MGQVAYALTPSGDNENTLTVEFEYDGIAFKDVEVTLYYVASWEDNEFVLTETFADSGVVLETTTTPSASEWQEMGETLEEYIGDIECDCNDCQYTDDDGVYVFEDLEDGVYYLAFADVYCEDGVLISDPVMVTLPAYDGTTNTWDSDPTVDLKVAFTLQPDDPDNPDDPDPYKPKKANDPKEPDDSEEPDVPEEPENSDTPEAIDAPDEQIIQEIPQTGSWSWIVTPLALLGMILFLFGVLGMVKKGREKDE